MTRMVSLTLSVLLMTLSLAAIPALVMVMSVPAQASGCGSNTTRASSTRPSTPVSGTPAAAGSDTHAGVRH